MAAGLLERRCNLAHQHAEGGDDRDGHVCGVAQPALRLLLQALPAISAAADTES
ncbi:MAG: hypothetical protein ABI212_10265 [Burkholderiaceae bacterium]